MPYRFPLPSVSYANPLESIPPSFTPVCVFPLCAQHNLFHPSCERISRLPFVTTYNRLREKRERRNIEWGAQVRRINLEIRMVRVLLFCVSTFAFTRIPEAINKLVRCWTRTASSRAHRENLTNCEKPLRHPFLSVQISFRVRYKPSLSLSLEYRCLFHLCANRSFSSFFSSRSNVYRIIERFESVNLSLVRLRRVSRVPSVHPYYCSMVERTFHGTAERQEGLLARTAYLHFTDDFTLLTAHAIHSGRGIIRDRKNYFHLRSYVRIVVQD